MKKSAKYLCDRYVERGVICPYSDCPHFGFHERIKGLVLDKTKKMTGTCAAVHYCEKMRMNVRCLTEKEVSELQSRKAPGSIPGTRGASGYVPDGREAGESPEGRSIAKDAPAPEIHEEKVCPRCFKPYQASGEICPICKGASKP